MHHLKVTDEGLFDRGPHLPHKSGLAVGLRAFEGTNNRKREVQGVAFTHRGTWKDTLVTDVVSTVPFTSLLPRRCLLDRTRRVGG